MLASEALGRALVESGADTVFANPGTTELHLVHGFAAAGMRQVLTLFEGIASGAADGYARITGKPAVVLVHLGPGLGNALANLHNARRANSPVVVVIGDHAIDHRPLDAPLHSDIAALAGAVSVWVCDCTDAADLAQAGRDAVREAVARRGVATLIVPADVAWSEVEAAPSGPALPAIAVTPGAAAADASAFLRGGAHPALLIGGGSLGAAGMRAARAIKDAGIADVLLDTFIPHQRRSGVDAEIEILPYFPEMARARLAGFDRVLLVGTKAPVGFFAYPGQPGTCLADDTASHRLPAGRDGLDATLGALAAALGVAPVASDAVAALSRVPAGDTLSAAHIGAILARCAPADAIVGDEANTNGAPIFAAMAAAPPHDWLRLTGGAIGQGLPLATGAAVAAPGRRVIALQADGSSLYTSQALWTQARERLDVTTILLSNRSYAILTYEMARLGLDLTPATAALFDLGDPAISFAALGTAMGVPSSTVDSPAAFEQALRQSLATPGPALIEAVLG